MATDTLSNDTFHDLSRRTPQDPDIQNTLSDFLTYTEHFPSHLTRALTLIGQQRAKSESKIKQIHDDTTKYALLPNLPQNDRPLSVQLRRDISYALEEAERACRMAVEEAIRVDDMAKRESSRLDAVTEKLKSQPMPPSRDPTPEQTALTSPNLKREDRLAARAAETGRPMDRTPRGRHNKAESKLRGRKVMVPGEVLPPPDPNASLEELSPWSSPRASPPLEQPPVPARRTTPRQRSRTPKLPKPEKRERRDRERERDKKARVPRQPGQPGTNAHSAVAGISTSNALLALTPPPEDAAKGSKWLPWMKLTEWEMAKLRKRMKKNAIWVPSLTMVRRELKNLGRGTAGKEAAKKAAEDGGPAFVDEGNEPDPTKILVSGEENNEANTVLANEYGIGEDDGGGGADDDAELINRGMRLNEAKKLKRMRMLEEQALQQQLASEQGVDIGAAASGGEADGKRKRKRESSPKVKEADEPSGASVQAPQKKLKITAPPISTAGLKGPVAPPASNPRKAATPPPTTSGRKPTITLKSSIKAVSEEPPARRASLRRGSNASLPGAGAGLTSLARGPVGTTTGRRSRRPAPGLVTAGDGESAKVSSSKRKAAPRKKSQQQQVAAQATQASKKSSSGNMPILDGADDYEPIDPNEPRYCICGDVSWGTMIACDNDDNCEKEWFHLSCVGLDDLPPRRTKWYCPDCRKKLKLGVGSNGLVGRNVGSSAGLTR